LGGQIIAALLVVILVLNRLKIKINVVAKITKFLSQNSIAVVLVISASAMMASLTLSEVLGFAPCQLCWYQRISMYPVAVISFIALITNDKIKKYVLTLSVIGMLVSIYHVLLQMFPTILECNDETAKCSAVQFAQFGYITIPVMSLTAFLLIVLVSLFSVSKKK
jgi:disulfide bond formation protein DsbB